MTAADRIERETEQSRLRVTELLDELRGRISPGEIMDQMMGLAGDGAAGEFVRNLGRQVRSNPLPCVLVGAGLAWLMMSNGQGRGNAAPARGAADAVGDTVEAAAEIGQTAGRAWANRAGDAIKEAGDTIRSADATARGAADAVGDTVEAAAEIGQTAGRAWANRAGDAIKEAGDTIRSAATATSSAAENVADSAVELGQRASGAARRAADTAAATGRRARMTIQDLLQEQPLVAAGLGIALGAVLGAALPATAAENRVMGGPSDELKARARRMAAEEGGKVRQVAERTYEAAKEHAAGAAEDVARDAAAAAQESGFPVGTLRAEHDRERALTEADPEAAGRSDTVEQAGREGSGEGQEQPHTRSAAK